MVDISKRLSAHIPFVRVDLYWIDRHIYFSEMTFYPGGGYGFFKPDEEENRIGNMLILSHTSFY